MAVVTAVAAGISVASTVVGGAVQAGQARKEARKFKNEKEAAAFWVKQLKEGRQDIINPYSGVTSLASLASDLSGQMSNPFAQLSVATQAAEMQAEEADISLANTPSGIWHHIGSCFTRSR